MNARIDEIDTARRALKWMLEHRVYWDRQVNGLLEAVRPRGAPVQPLCRPPADVELMIIQVALEIDLEAVHAR